MPRKINTRTVHFRRKRVGKTDYRARSRLLLAKKPRLVVRRSLKNMLLQVVEYSSEGDKIVLSVHSHELKELGWKGNSNNLPACYLLGLLLAKKAKEKNVKECILDIGSAPSVKGCSLYGVLKGGVDGGLVIPHSDTVFPDGARIRGEHIADFARKIKVDKERFNKQFAAYLKNGLDPESLPAHFDIVKNKLRGKE